MHLLNYTGQNSNKLTRKQSELKSVQLILKIKKVKTGNIKTINHELKIKPQPKSICNSQEIGFHLFLLRLHPKLTEMGKIVVNFFILQELQIFFYENNWSEP